MGFLEWAGNGSGEEVVGGNRVGFVVLGGGKSAWEGEPNLDRGEKQTVMPRVVIEGLSRSLENFKV